MKDAITPRQITGRNLVSGADEAWWYDEPHILTVCARVTPGCTTTIVAIPWRAIEAALKRRGDAG